MYYASRMKNNYFVLADVPWFITFNGSLKNHLHWALESQEAQLRAVLILTAEESKLDMKFISITEALRVELYNVSEFDIASLNFANAKYKRH